MLSIDDMTTMGIHNIFAQAPTMRSPTPNVNTPFFLYSSISLRSLSETKKKAGL